MDKIIPISDLQSKTKEIIEEVKRTRDPVIITQRGRPAALVVNYEEYEGMRHTLDEMSYPDWQERLERAKKESEAGESISLEDLIEERKHRAASRKISKKR